MDDDLIVLDDGCLETVGVVERLGTVWLVTSLFELCDGCGLPLVGVPVRFGRPGLGVSLLAAVFPWVDLAVGTGEDLGVVEVPDTVLAGTLSPLVILAS